jgi:hypothetical protein
VRISAAFSLATQRAQCCALQSAQQRRFVRSEACHVAPSTDCLSGARATGSIEKQARLARIPKSAWAGQVLNQALAGQGPSTDRVFDQIIKIRATLDALVAAQPQREEIRRRIDVKVQRYSTEAQRSLPL